MKRAGRLGTSKQYQTACRLRTKLMSMLASVKSLGRRPFAGSISVFSVSSVTKICVNPRNPRLTKKPCPLWLKYAKQTQFLKRPNERKSLYNNDLPITSNQLPMTKTKPKQTQTNPILSTNHKQRTMNYEQ